MTGAMNRAPTKFTRASCLTPHAYPVITAVALLPLLSVTVTVVVPAMLIEQGLQPAAIIGALRLSSTGPAAPVEVTIISPPGQPVIVNEQTGAPGVRPKPHKLLQQFPVPVVPSDASLQE
jgi:hypothetical protein